MRERQLLTTGESSRTTNPLALGEAASASSSLTPVLPICDAVIVTICPKYEGSVRISWYPVMEGLKTHSPAIEASAPKAIRRKTLPSCRATAAGFVGGTTG